MKASEIAKFLGLELHGPNCEVDYPVLQGKEGFQTMSFSKLLGKISFSDSHINTSDPKRDFFLVVREFFFLHKRLIAISPDCIISQPTSIGGTGFNVVLDKNGNPFNIPHIGGVKIGHHVEIGHFNTIARGVLGDTIVGNYVKTDDHVHIAHNCIIGNKCQLASHVALGGSVTIGSNCFIGVGAIIKNQITIGPNNLVGAGAVVIKDICEGEVWAGNPAKFLRRREDGDL